MCMHMGILLYEMVHGKAAYDKQHQQQVLVSVMHGFRPQWQVPDEGQLPELRALYLRCVDEDPDARPTATDLVAQLGQLEEAARLESRLESQETPRASRWMVQFGFNSCHCSKRTLVGQGACHVVWCVVVWCVAMWCYAGERTGWKAKGWGYVVG